MPTITAYLSLDHSAESRVQASIDGGSGISFVDEKLFEAAKDQFLQYGELVIIEPTVLTAFNGTDVVVTRMVKGARVAIGRYGWFEIDLLVVPGTQYAMLLGSDFQYRFDGHARLAQGHFTMSLPATCLRPGADPSTVPYYQSVPLSLRTFWTYRPVVR
jgi:hypothetical protein